jgi:hypothetical protein
MEEVYEGVATRLKRVKTPQVILRCERSINRVAEVLAARTPTRSSHPRTSSRIVRFWIGALSLCGGLVVSAVSSAEDAPSPQPPRAEAVLVGSSSFNQSFGQLIERELGRWGYQVTRKGVSGAGLARPDFHDMNQDLESLPIGTNTAAVFVYLGVNDAQAVWLYPHERGSNGLDSLPFGAAEWDAVYARRAREFLSRICQRGARRAVVLLPVDVTEPELQRRLDHIRDLQVQAASDTSCAAVVSTAGDAGHFDAGGSPKRLPDGFHMSSLGAKIVWDRIESQVTRLLEAEAPH